MSLYDKPNEVTPYPKGYGKELWEKHLLTKLKKTAYEGMDFTKIKDRYNWK